MAPLFLIRSTILQYLSFSRAFNMLTITSSSPEYRFCSALILSVEEIISSLYSLRADINISIVPPIPTILL